MRVDIDWLREFVDFDWAAEELADRLTMAGLEAYPGKEDGAEFIEVEITSNRSDWLSVLGIAREIAALRRIQISPPEVEQVAKGQVDYRLSVQGDCAARYFGLRIDNVKVGPSPEWLSRRLRASGIRPINNIVDVTNYTMLLFGQPLHAFDFDRIEGKELLVRRARKGERIVTLDGEERPLVPSDIVIADSNRPIALAGIMGGENSEVRQDTRSILLESAMFPRVDIRKTRQRLGINTEASYRFEREIDPEAVERACFYAAKLISELSGGRVLGYDVYDTYIPVDRIVSFPVDFPLEYADVDIAVAEQVRILTGLGLECEEKEGIIDIRVPSFRADISSKEDILEEILRIYGYDKIPTIMPGIGLNNLRGRHSLKERLLSEIRCKLEARGLSEAVSFSLISEKEREALSLKGLMSVENTISQDYLFLRPSPMPGLLSALKTNLSHGNRYIRLYEISQALTKEDLCIERDVLSVMVVEKDLDTAFRLVKRIIEDVLDSIGTRIKGAKSKVLSSFAEIYSGDKRLGLFGKVRNVVLKQLGIKTRDVVYYLEIDLFELLDLLGERKLPYRPIPLYPPVERDISMWLSSRANHQEIVSIIRDAAGEYLKEIELIDIFHSPDGRLSYAYRLRFYHPSRTLKEEEINPDFDRIIRALKAASLDVRAV